MQDTRCGCGALLFRAAAGAIAGRLDIKCRRCGTLNSLRPIEPTKPERRERQSNGDDACSIEPKR